jgi:hypothetical protein
VEYSAEIWGLLNATNSTKKHLFLGVIDRGEITQITQKNSSLINSFSLQTAGIGITLNEQNKSKRSHIA